MAGKYIKIPDIKALALNPQFAYRTELMQVPEWGDITVQIREVSPTAWVEFRARTRNLLPEDVNDPDFEALSLRSAEAETTLLVSVLHDEHGKPVFTRDDIPELAKIYGPVHSRIVNRALQLSSSSGDLVGDAKKK